MDAGAEIFSLSKGWNMTGWRCAAIAGNADAIAAYWRLKTNVDSGLFEAVQLDAPIEDHALYIVDTENHAIRAVMDGGEVFTVALRLGVGQHDVAVA